MEQFHAASCETTTDGGAAGKERDALSGQDDSGLPIGPLPLYRNSSMRTNLRSIAAAAGVGLATASRALRGLAGVDPKTRERVRKAADRLGYVRDPLLSNAFAFARRPGKPVYRETLAFLAAEKPENYAHIAWLKGIHTGFVSRAEELGYAVRSFVTSRQERAQMALSRQLHAQGIRGVAVMAVTAWAPFHLKMQWDRFTAVEIGHSLWTPELPRIDRDLADDFALMFNELRIRGYRRIGLAMNRDDEVRRRWGVLAAYLLFQHRNPDLPKLVPLEDAQPYHATGLLRWLRAEKPDAIVVNGPEPHDWLEEAGIDIPGKLALCRLDCVDRRPETGLSADYPGMGSAAVNLLSGTLERADFGLVDRRPILNIPNIWREGFTLRPRPAKEPALAIPVLQSTRP